MSYALARAQIASIITAITPTAEPSSKFAELKSVDLSGKDRPADRRFEILSTEARVYTPLTSTRREVRNLRVTVHYRESANKAALDLKIASDFTDLQRALLLPSGWNRPTSTIESLALLEGGGGSTILQASIEEDEGAVRQILEFPVLYTA